VFPSLALKRADTASTDHFDRLLIFIEVKVCVLFNFNGLLQIQNDFDTKMALVASQAKIPSHIHKVSGLCTPCLHDGLFLFATKNHALASAHPHMWQQQQKISYTS
jgi:hypothetical protein